MLGIGTWEFPINTMFYMGKVQIDITDNNGEYGFALRVPGQKLPPAEIRGVRENDNTLHIAARAMNKSIALSITFDGDRASAIVKAPFVGMVKLNNGRKNA